MGQEGMIEASISTLCDAYLKTFEKEKEILEGSRRELNGLRQFRIKLVKVFNEKGIDLEWLCQLGNDILNGTNYISLDCKKEKKKHGSKNG